MTMIGNLRTVRLLGALGAIALVGGCGGGGRGAPPVTPTAHVTLRGTIAVPGTTLAGALDVGGAARADTDVLVALLGPEPARVESLAASLGLRRCGGFGRLSTWRAPADAEPEALRTALEHAEPGALTRFSVHGPRRGALEPTDPGYVAWQWNLRAIGAPQAWDLTEGSIGVVVAVIDSGVALAHSELNGRLLAGYDFVSDPTSAADGDGPDPDPTDPVKPATGRVAHGTVVAGVLAANVDGRGIVGVDHRCRVMPLRALGADGRGDPADTWSALIFAGDLDDADLAGFAWFTELFPDGLPADRPRPSEPARVVNLSIATTFDRASAALAIEVERDLLRALVAKGITVVAAAGNGGRELEDATSIVLPAAEPAVLTVGAVLRDGLAAAPSSNTGAAIDLCAPGGTLDPAAALGDPLAVPESGGVPALDAPPRNLTWHAGTSVAAAQVSGVVALMLALRPNATPAELESALRATARDRGAAGVDPAHGAGLVQAARALYAIAGGIAPPEQLVAYDALVRIPADADGAAIDIGNLAGPLRRLAPLRITVDHRGAPSEFVRFATWLDDGDARDAPLTITVDRSGLPDGVFEARVRIESLLGGDLELPVRIVQRSAVPPPPFAIWHVEARDAVTGDPLASADRAITVQSFELTDVPLPAHRAVVVVAGSDLDGDGSIDEDGELFGVDRVGPDARVLRLADGAVVQDLAIELVRRARP